MKTLLLALALALAPLAAARADENPFAKPESVYWDGASKHWFVSSVAGSPLEKDGTGWVSRLDADGKVLDAKWVAGLNAPKGMRSHGGKLYVADLDELAVIGVAEGKLERKIPFPGAKFLNDVAVDGAGNVYVSDTLTDTIYRLPAAAGGEAPKAEVFLKSPDLESPNGILVDGKLLVIAAWGKGIDPATFATQGPGRILLLNLETKQMRPFGDGRPIGGLDGIEKDGRTYLVTDNPAGKLLRVHQDGSFTEEKTGLRGGADIGFDATRRLLLIPEMGADNLIVEKIQRPEKRDGSGKKKGAKQKGEGKGRGAKQ